MDKIEAMRLFVASAEHGSFAVAAHKTNRNQPAVAKAVADLETQLNVQLLNRAGRSVALTEAGHHYFGRAKEVLAAHVVFERPVSNEKEPNGVLKISTPTNFGSYYLMPLVRAFMTKYPSVDCKVLLVDESFSLVEEGIDVAVKYGHLPDSSYKAIKVFEARLGVFASPDYISKRGAPKSPDDLHEHSIISTPCLTPSPDRWAFTMPAGETLVPVKPRLIVNRIEVAADAGAHGLGLTYLASYQAAEYVAAGRLIEVLNAFSVERMPFHLVRTSGRYTSPKVRAFIEEVSGGLKDRF